METSLTRKQEGHCPLPRAHSAKGARVVLASSFGALLEWYDLYIYAALASTFAHLFFPPGNPTAAALSSLAVFGAAFVLRPIGAIVFGYIGDRVGRKRTFGMTIVLIGGATLGIGLLPTYAHIGILAPTLLVVLRLLQGLALGGEVGGAATYLTEHADQRRRGFMSSFLQVTATGGLVLSIAVVTVTRACMSTAAFETWGWRVPFLVSLILLFIAIKLRAGLGESPVFEQYKAEGKLARNPIAASFLDRKNLKNVFVLLFSAASGVGVLYGTAHFYSFYFVGTVLKVDPETTNLLMVMSLLAAAPFYFVSGWMSDRFGRKWVMVLACLAAALTIQPAFKALTHFANPGLETFLANTKVEVSANNCKFHLFSAPASDCDKVRDFLSASGVSYTMTPATSDSVVTRIGSQRIDNFDVPALKSALESAGWQAHADERQINKPMVFLILWYLIVLLAMVYGPIVAFMVELFPANVRYTSLSLPYHIGSGWFGGMLPFVVSAMNLSLGNVYGGLWYPVGVAALSFVVGACFMTETRHNKID
ncbi:MFS transporter [Pandoraea aquatica]|uniref:MFS transporter n=1 Tax=Pandoraea aquatica TaxID=2508290 RepID=A0A5E4VVH7_9BURK|nr:MFS transporter [Pandoraea aquatica]VVE14985.1 MFS transporter [Pandoraea aquatica]